MVLPCMLVAGLQIIGQEAFRSLVGVDTNTIASPCYGTEAPNLVAGKYWPKDTKLISDKQPVYTTNIGDCTAGLFLANVLGEDSEIKLASDIFFHLNCGRNLDQASKLEKFNPFALNNYNKTYIEKEFRPLVNQFFAQLDYVISSGKLKGKTLEFTSLLAGGWQHSDFPQDQRTVNRSSVLKNKLEKMIHENLENTKCLANEHSVELNHLEYLLWGQAVRTTKTLKEDEILVPLTHIHYDPGERIISVNYSHGTPAIEDDGSDYGKFVIKHKYQKRPSKHFEQVKVV